MYEYAHENGFELISRGIKIDFLGFILTNYRQAIHFSINIEELTQLKEEALKELLNEQIKKVVE
jgi:hypothetical protein